MSLPFGDNIINHLLNGLNFLKIGASNVILSNHSLFYFFKEVIIHYCFMVLKNHIQLPT